MEGPGGRRMQFVHVCSVGGPVHVFSGPDRFLDNTGRVETLRHRPGTVQNWSTSVKPRDGPINVVFKGGPKLLSPTELCRNGKSWSRFVRPDRRYPLFSCNIR